MNQLIYSLQGVTTPKWHATMWAAELVRGWIFGSLFIPFGDVEFFSTFFLVCSVKKNDGN